MGKSAKKDALRLSLYNEGRAALSALGINEDIYICPICLAHHNKDALRHKRGQEPQLTLEHVPPKSVGGKEILLTCKGCNNFAGHAYDAHLDGLGKLHKRSNGMLRKEDGNYGRVKVTGESAQVNAELEIKNGTFVFNIPENKNNPLKIEEFTDFLRQLDTGGDVTFSLEERSNPNRTNFSLLRSAYLVMVATFGYSYAFASNIQKLRKAIDNEQLDFPTRFMRPNKAPENCIILFENLDVALVQFDRIAVLMPLISSNENNYENYTRPDSVISGNCRKVRFPESFIAVADHSGRYVARTKQSPAPDPRGGA